MAKLSSSGRTVTPLNVSLDGAVIPCDAFLDEAPMELSTVGKKRNGFAKQFQRMLSQGQGVSVFEALKQEGLKEGANASPFADQILFAAKDSDGFTILHHAARCNQAEAVTFLLDSCGVDIDQVENKGFTALHVAVRHRGTEVIKVLLQKGADPTISDNENDTPLLFAARKAYTEIAALLLNDPRTNVNHANSAKITPFLAACASGDRNLCELLLAHGAELTAKTSNLTTAVHCAAFNGHVEIFELLISAAKKRQISLKDFLEARDVEDSVALHMSCCKGFRGVVELLLHHGVDLEAPRGLNFGTPLHSAALHGHEEITKLLISSGAVIDSRDGHLNTPLHLAAQYNETKTAEILLENGAGIEVKNMLDMTPFLYAVVHGAKEAAEMLLDRGADLMALDSRRSSALHLAVIQRRSEVFRMLLERSKGKLLELRNYDLETVIHVAACYEETEILDVLLDQNISVEQKDINNKIPLHHAAENGSLECIKSLVRCPMFLKLVNDRDQHGMAPLHLAALNKHTEACRLIVGRGGDVTVQDHKQNTPLHLAVKAGSLETVKFLLNPMIPSTLEIKDAEENTGLHIACMHNRLDVLKYLLDQGADVGARNKDDMTCLDVAIEWDSLDVAKTLVKHERWKEVVTASSKDQVKPMEKLIIKLPEVAEIVLDQCITYCNRPSTHPDFTVTFTLFVLDPFDVLSGCRYFFGPGTMAKYRREGLLNHSVTQVLLRWKWLVLGKFLNYLNFALFFVFLVLFSFFIVDQRSKVRLSGSSEVDKAMNSDESSRGISGVIFAVGILKILTEIIQMVWLRLNYFKDYTNFVDLSMHVAALIYILPYVTKDDLYGNALVQWRAGTIALLLIYVNWILSLRRISSVALYVTMYVEVLVTFVKVIALFTVVLIGYALVFHVLLKEEDNFSSVGLSFVKIFVMMVGEMDYSDVLTSNVVNNATVPGTTIPYVPLPTLSYVMFMLFVLSVSIILMNLLVGLAVGDIDSIQKTATLRNLIDQATLVDDIQKRYPKWILRHFYKDSLKIRPNQNPVLTRLALSGSGLTDGDFVDSLRKRQSNDTAEDDQDLDNYEQQRRERQDERIKNLQATVDAQGELLRAIADKLQIGK